MSMLPSVHHTHRKSRGDDDIFASLAPDILPVLEAILNDILINNLLNLMSRSY